MPATASDRPGWHVRIRRTLDTEPVGAGVLVTDTHVVTCAHVVAPGEAAPQGPVFVEFQFAARHEPVLAVVVEGGWCAQRPDGSGDVAVLELRGPLPAGAAPAPLRESAGVEEHPFRAYGYPRGHERGGVWSHGLIVGPAELEWVQLEADTTQGFSLKQGFSGAPIWDDELEAVVGIVVSTDREVDVRTGYGIPVEVIGRYWAGLGPWVGWRLSHDPAMASHWGPRARGVERDSRPGWYFTGRRQALRELVAWLEGAPADGGIRVVTGGPGSGKSAVLARLVALADPAWRARVEREDPTQLDDPTTVPSVGRISVAVHVAGLDLGQTTCRIAAAVSAAAEDPDALIADIRRRGRGLVVVVDALDEAVTAAEARAIAAKLLVPLARDAADLGVKVLVGTRAGPDGMFLRAFGGRAEIVDLDLPRYLDLADLAGYAARSLRLAFDPTATSPYRDDAQATAAVALAIARAAFPSFLVAGLTARAYAEDERVLDVSAPDWQERAAFPADVDMAMADYLDRLGDPRRAFDLLVPVAYARYPGLPRDSLWVPLAEAYSGKPYGPADVDWLLATAGSFLLEETDDAGDATVRLFHRALVDHVRGRTQPPLVEGTITEVLTERAREAGGWLQAERYARLHAASHAAVAEGELLDRLVTDPAFLLAADRRGLLRALPSLTDPEARLAGECYRAAASRLSGDTATDATYLELASMIEGDKALAAAVRGLGEPQPFTTAFGWRPPSADASLPTGHTGGVLGVEWGVLEGEAVLVTAGFDGTVRLWDPAEGRQISVLESRSGSMWALAWGVVDGRPVLASGGFDGAIRLANPAGGTQIRMLEGHRFGVLALAWGTLDGAAVLASAGADGTVRLWDPVGGMQIRVWEGHTGGVWSLAWDTLDGVPVVVTAGADGAVRLWDPADATQIRALEGHIGSVWTLVCGIQDGRPVLASAGDDGTVRLWDPADATQVHLLKGHSGPVWALAWGTVDGVPVLASAGDDATVRLWDCASGIPLRRLEGHTGWAMELAWGTVDDVPVLASAGDDGTVRLWDPADATQIRVLEGNNGGVWALLWGMLDGVPVLASAGDDGTVRLWDPAERAQIRVLEGHTGWVRALAWGTLDGAPVLASSGDDGTIRLWDPADATQIRVLEGHTGSVRALAWGTLDGAPVLASAGSDAVVRLWSPAEGTQQRPLVGHAGGVLTLAWGELDGATVLASAGSDATVRLWDAAHGTQLRPMEGGSGSMWAVAWSMLDGAQVLASAGFDGTVRLWDPAAGTQLRVLRGHLAWVFSVAWGTLEGAPVLISASLDGTVRLWDPGPEPAAAMVIEFGGGPVFAVSVSSGGWLAVAGREGLAVLEIQPGAFTDARSARRRPLSLIPDVETRG